MLMLIDTPGRGPRGGPDPDEDRECRWEPIGLRSFLPAAGSISCLVLSGVADAPVNHVLTGAAVAFCLAFVRAEWPGRSDDDR